MLNSRKNEDTFHTLLRGFVGSTAGHAQTAEPGDVLEFVFGDFVARAYLLPRDTSLVVIEVDIRGLDLADVAKVTNPLLMLHRMNDTGPFDHGWTVSIDDDDMLAIHTMPPLAGMTVDRLKSLIDEGLDRADRLGDLWKRACELRPMAADERLDLTLNALRE